MVFSAGTHTDAIRLHYGDFADLIHPVVGAIARPAPARDPASTSALGRSSAGV
jgi:hypothetical protein